MLIYVNDTLTSLDKLDRRIHEGYAILHNGVKVRVYSCKEEDINTLNLDNRLMSQYIYGVIHIGEKGKPRSIAWRLDGKGIKAELQIKELYIYE